MAKGHWIAHVDVTDPEGYNHYQAANAVAFRNMAHAFWCAVVPLSGRRAGCDPGTRDRVRGLHHGARLLSLTRV
jgi:Domain of unknown function (DUF1330)